MNKRTSWLLFSLCLLIFLSLLILISTVPLRVTAVDSMIRNWVNQFHSPVANAFWEQITSMFNAQASVFWAFGVSLAAFIGHDWYFGLQITSTIFGGLILNHLVKTVVCRPRPVIRVLMHYSGYSFPSGHSSTAVLIMGSLILMVNHWLHSHHLKAFLDTCLVLIIILVGFSRIFVGAHFPSDVLAGWSLGVFVLSGINLLAIKFDPSKVIHQQP